LTHRTWAEVSLGRLAQNFVALQRFGPLTPVIKADAYGHGLLPCAKNLINAGAESLSVATLAEAIALRESGVAANKAIYTLSALLPEEAEACALHQITPFVSSIDFFERLPRSSPCFLAIDSGMGREGVTPTEALACLNASKIIGAPKIIGLATHFSSADEEDLAPTEQQQHAFDGFLRLCGPGATDKILSLTNSPALLRGVPSGLHRPGAVLYGIAPYPSSLDGTQVQPVLALKSRLTLVKPLSKGATVGYGRTHTLTRNSVIATIPIGYGDGWLRSLSNCGVALVRGRRCRLIGRVSMDQCQLDVTDVCDAMIGDVATLIGTDGEETITAAEVAEIAQTTCHEITTQLSNRVPRLYV
jgi:alanine racemase